MTATHNPLAERATVGAALCGQPVEDRARLLSLCSPQDFHDQTLAETFEVVRDLHQSGVVITLPVVNKHLAGKPLAGRSQEQLAALYLEGQTLNQDAHARIVRHDADRRRALAATALLDEKIRNDDPWGDHLATISELHQAHVNAGTGTLEIINLVHLEERGPRPELFDIPNGSPLFYRGAIHDLHGEPSVGKTWLALIAAVEDLNAGRGACLVDFEDTEHTCRARLLALGCTLEHLERFSYVRGKLFTEDDLGALRTLCAGLDGGPVIIDSVAAALAAHGLDENSNTDVSNWIVNFARPLARTGSSVILLDHVGKNKQDRARGARGAGAKLAAIDGASYEVIGQGFSRTQAGTVKLKIAKDRHGHVGAVGSIAAEITLTPGDQDTILISATHSEGPITSSGEFRPTHVMEEISDWASSHPDGFEFLLQDLNPRDGQARPIERKKDVIKAAVLRLVIEGHLVQRSGLRSGSYYYRLEKPFEAEDDGARSPSRPLRAPTQNDPPDPSRPSAPLRAPLAPPLAPPRAPTAQDQTESFAPLAPPPLIGARDGAKNEDPPTTDDDIF